MRHKTRRGFLLGLLAATAALACRRRTPSATGSTVSTSPPITNPSPDDGASQTASGSIPRRALGRTGVSVSMIGLGGFHIGQKLSEPDSIRLIRKAVDQGVNFLDNCWDYNGGDSEARMGKALQDGYRQRVFLMTKIDGRTRKAALEQLDQSLRRLQTDSIDLVQIHEVIRPNDPERCFASNGTIPALMEARAAGKLRFIGFTGHKDPAIHLSMLATAKKHGFRFDTVQMPLNVMDEHYKSFRRQVLPVLLENEIGILGMKSLGSGDILKSGVVTAEECLRYALGLPASVIICGMDSFEVLEQNIKLAQNFRPLTAGQLEDLFGRTSAAAASGKYEAFKTSQKYDGTERNPYWLEEARI